MSVKRLAQITIGLLVVQFILGKLANLYATIPEHKPYEVFHYVGYISVHATNAAVLIVLAIVLVVKTRRQVALKPAIGGLLNLIIAFIFGELFVFLQNDIFSLLMAIAFVGALMSYARIVFTNSDTSK